MSAALTHGLFHLAIKTADLGATRAFWTGVIGLHEVPRPDFGYPGAWLACGQPGGQAIVHVYAGGPALGDGAAVPRGTAAIDHVSLACSGYHAYVGRFRTAGLDWREFLVPGTTLWQLMVLQAPTPLDGMQCISGVSPGARILLRADGEHRVKAVLAAVDAIEAAGIDPCAVAPVYWCMAGNRLAARLPLPTYTPERHAAHLARGALQ